jgi:hypothetical protein
MDKHALVTLIANLLLAMEDYACSAIMLLMESTVMQRHAVLIMIVHQKHALVEYAVLAIMQ